LKRPWRTDRAPFVTQLGPTHRGKWCASRCQRYGSRSRNVVGCERYFAVGATGFRVTRASRKELASARLFSFEIATEASDQSWALPVAIRYVGTAVPPAGALA
jgi:hypothetical protein